jgi:hypothetical protein
MDLLSHYYEEMPFVFEGPWHGWMGGSNLQGTAFDGPLYYIEE